jgi:hypothetical protein
MGSLGQPRILFIIIVDKHSHCSYKSNQTYLCLICQMSLIRTSMHSLETITVFWPGNFWSAPCVAVYSSFNTSCIALMNCHYSDNYHQQVCITIPVATINRYVQQYLSLPSTGMYNNTCRYHQQVCTIIPVANDRIHGSTHNTSWIALMNCHYSDNYHQRVHVQHNLSWTT